MFCGATIRPSSLSNQLLVVLARFGSKRLVVSPAPRPTLRVVEGGPRVLDLEALVPAIATGNEPASDLLYDATSGLLFGLLLLMLSDTASAEKVLFEVYAEAQEQAARFNRNRESLLTWLITIAHRRALEHLCSSSEDQQFLVSSGLAGPQLTGSTRIGKSAHRRLVGAMLESFSPAERKMIELAYFSHMTPRAIALELRQSAAIVTAGLQSGVAHLYNLFKIQEGVSEVEPLSPRSQREHFLRSPPLA